MSNNYRSINIGEAQRPSPATGFQAPMQVHSSYRSLAVQQPVGLQRHVPGGTTKQMHQPMHRPLVHSMQPKPVFIQQPQSSFPAQQKRREIVRAPFLPVDISDYGLDPGSYAFSDLSAGEMLKALATALRRTEVDAEVRPDKCKCKCIAPVGNVRFVARIFQLTPAERAESGGLGGLVVVLQRRNAALPGDWAQVACTVLAELVRAGSVKTDFDVERSLRLSTQRCTAAPTVSSTSSSTTDSIPNCARLSLPCSPPALERSSTSSSVEENGLKHLLELAQSPFGDVREQASEILRSLSRNVGVAELLDRLEAVDTLCAGVGNTVTDTKQQDAAWTVAAVSTIANLCARRKDGQVPNKSSTAPAVMVLDVVVQLFLALKDTTSYLRYELRRETARALAALTRDPLAAKQLTEDHPQLVAAMRTCVGNEALDHALAAHAKSTLTNIQASC